MGVMWRGEGCRQELRREAKEVRMVAAASESDLGVGSDRAVDRDVSKVAASSDTTVK